MASKRRIKKTTIKVWKEAALHERDRFGISVSPYGDDRGTLEALQHRGIAECVDPTGDTKRSVARVDDLLIRWHRKGDIDGDQYHVGQEFQKAFARAGIGSYSAVDCSAIGGGSHDGNHYIEVLTDSHKRVRDMLNRVGGKDSLSGSAMWWILGYGLSLREIEKRQKKNRMFLTGALQSGLQILALDYRNKKI